MEHAYLQEPTVHINDDEVYETYHILRNEMKKYGRSVALPEKTDHKKTYSWRYLYNFTHKMKIMNIDDKYVPMVIEALLTHAKGHKLLDRGFEILSKVDIIELIIKKLEKECQADTSILYTINSTKKFLENHDDLVTTLKSRRCAKAYTNMTCWFQQGFISLNYITLSRACRKVMAIMDESERSLYPNALMLMKKRLQLLHNDMQHEIKQAMAGDLFREAL